MFKITITHEGVPLEIPASDNLQGAITVYTQQCAHYAADCALVGGSCEIQLENPSGSILRKTRISSSV